MLEQSKYRLLGCLDYSLSAFFQVGLNEKAIYSEFRITAVMPESQLHSALFHLGQQLVYR